MSRCKIEQQQVINMHTVLIILLLAILVDTSRCLNVSKIQTSYVFDEKIVGGQLVSIEDYPYQLSLQIKGKHICGAAMIGSSWALTAAHCTDGLSVINVTVRAGSSYYFYGGQEVPVRKIHNHRSYNPDTLDMDISVLELAAPITTKKASIISMASWYNFLFPWLRGTATGWGYTKENGTTSLQLRAVTVPIISSHDCYLSYGSLLTRNMFCAGKYNRDSCQGDSGGPLVINGKLYGIVSFGIGCGRPNFPGVYTKVSAFRSFIKGISGI